MKSVECYYEILEVSPRASPAVIKAAYRCLVQLHHPDKLPSEASPSKCVVKINLAYAMLSDPETRGRYDALNIGRSIPAVMERRGAGVRNAHAIRPMGAGTNSPAVMRPFAFRPLNK